LVIANPSAGKFSTHLQYRFETSITRECHTDLVEVWFLNIDQFVHSLQTVLSGFHDVCALQRGVVVPVYRTVRPDSE
jgi:hypothetical protein